MLPLLTYLTATETNRVSLVEVAGSCAIALIIWTQMQHVTVHLTPVHLSALVFKRMMSTADGFQTSTYIYTHIYFCPPSVSLTIPIWCSPGWVMGTWREKKGLKVEFLHRVDILIHFQFQRNAAAIQDFASMKHLASMQEHKHAPKDMEPWLLHSWHLSVRVYQQGFFDAHHYNVYSWSRVLLECAGLYSVLFTGALC